MKRSAKNKIAQSYFIFIFFFLNIIQVRLALAESENASKKAVIFGVTGQDGAYLAELLLSKNYEVHGIARRFPALNHELTQAIFAHPCFVFHIGDVTHFSNLIQLIGNIQPDEIYNLAAQTHVKLSFDEPEETAKVNGLGTLHILEAIRVLGLTQKLKFFQASSSELFGDIKESPQTENTPFHPRSPYGVAKLYGYWMTVNYQEAYGLFACNGILFNHESPLRGEAFITRKITLAACRYQLGFQDVLYLGNLDAKRDWGYAKDYVEAMWLMLQSEKPDHYVISTGEAHSVREFVELAFKELDIDIEWHGEGIEEYGVDKVTQKMIVKVDPQYYRPNEVDCLLGKAEKAEKILKWKPRTSFRELVKIMIEADYQKVLTEKNNNF